MLRGTVFSPTVKAGRIIQKTSSLTLISFPEIPVFPVIPPIIATTFITSNLQYSSFVLKDQGQSKPSQGKQVLKIAKLSRI